MIERIANLLRPVLESSVVRKARRNHALEHATVHMLAARIKGLRIAGRSSDGGYILIGNVPQEAVEKAAEEALERMRKGEAKLALHPNCGTNLVTTGAMATLAGVLGLGSGRRVTADRIAWTMVLMMGAVLSSQSVGMKLQEHITTKGDIGDLEIVSITRREARWPFADKPIVIHNIVTRKG